MGKLTDVVQWGVSLQSLEVIKVLCAAILHPPPRICNNRARFVRVLS
jgi:hypothetical protein